MKWLKNKLRQWLLKEELEELELVRDLYFTAEDNFSRANKVLKDTIQETKNAKSTYQQSKRDLEDAKRTVNEIVEVGVDVHPYARDSGSWAVICIDGKPNYMKFVRFERNDVRSLQEFLRRFEYSRHVVDSPYGFRNDFWFEN